jgi:hypothetical protein
MCPQQGGQALGGGGVAAAAAAKGRGGGGMPPRTGMRRGAVRRGDASITHGEYGEMSQLLEELKVSDPADEAMPNRYAFLVGEERLAGTSVGKPESWFFFFSGGRELVSLRVRGGKSSLGIHKSSSCD